MDAIQIWLKNAAMPTRVDFRLYEGDCMDCLDSIDDGSQQLIATSPPYNIGKEYEKRSSMHDYLTRQKRLIDACYPKLTETGAMCWQAGNYVDDDMVVPLDVKLFPMFQELGMFSRGRIAWTFGSGLHCSKRFSGRYETILWFTKSREYVFNLDPVRIPAKYPNKRHYKGPNKGKLACNPLGKNPTDVWDIPNVKHNHVEWTEHPAQFPVALAERLVLALSNEGDSVYDPYAGAGTTLVAALKHGRAAIGSEIMPEYVRIARDRIKQLKNGTLRTRDMNKPVQEFASRHHIDAYSAAQNKSLDSF